jgi:hypothetical protein
VWVAAVGIGRRGRSGSVGGVGSAQRRWEEVEAHEAALRGGEEEERKRGQGFELVLYCVNTIRAIELEMDGHKLLGCLG